MKNGYDLKCNRAIERKCYRASVDTLCRDLMSEISYSRAVEEASRYKVKTLRFLEKIIQFPTVSPRDHDSLRACADELVRQFEMSGFRASRFDTTGDPIVTAEKDRGAKKTLLFYHHYDVQPEGPLEHWLSSPWKMEVRGDRAYGRGAIDDKGPIAASMMGVLLAEELLGELPINVRFVIEGEEEAGSISLHEFTETHKDFIKADGLIWEGISSMPGSPAEVTCGVKGDAYFEVRSSGPPKFPRTDVHSGEAAGVPNAAWRLIWALNTLKDEDENILIDGFQDLVAPPSEDDIAVLREYEGDYAQKMIEDYGLSETLGNRKGLDFLKHLYLMPTLTISGLTSGYQGSEDMTIVPSSASAKLDVRLVPELTPEKVHELLKGHLAKKGFDDMEIKMSPGYYPSRSSVNDPFIRMVHGLSKEVTAPAPSNIVPMIGASGPAYHFTPYAPMCMACSNADIEHTNMHAPNENFWIPSLVNNVAFIAMVVDRMSGIR